MSDFITLPFRLHRNDPNWIPQLLMHEKAQFNPAKNPAFRYCDARFFLAVRDGVAVGRVAAIINRKLIEKLGVNRGRFCWFDCEENRETAEMLMDAAEEWLASMGMTEVTGPMGFTDNDQTGVRFGAVAPIEQHRPGPHRPTGA